MLRSSPNLLYLSASALTFLPSTVSVLSPLFYSSVPIFFSCPSCQYNISLILLLFPGFPSLPASFNFLSSSASPLLPSLTFFLLFPLLLLVSLARSMSLLLFRYPSSFPAPLIPCQVHPSTRAEHSRTGQTAKINKPQEGMRTQVDRDGTTPHHTTPPPVYNIHLPVSPTTTTHTTVLYTHPPTQHHRTNCHVALIQHSMWALMCARGHIRGSD